MSEMKKWVVELEANSFNGNQSFLVEAEDEEAALLKFNESGGEVIETDVEILDFDEPELDAIYEYEEPEPKPQIKPIDEHEWDEDSNIKSVDICTGGDIEITTVFYGVDIEVYVNGEDLAVILAAKGEKRVKITTLTPEEKAATVKAGGFLDAGSEL